MKEQQRIWKKMTTPIEIDTTPFSLFSDVKEVFDAHVLGGYCVRCPMSGTIHNMPYRRTISKGMARALKQLYQIQVNRINNGVAPNSFADFTKLRHWGLIRQDADTQHWHITEKGIQFYRREIRVPKNAIVVNNQFREYMGDDVSFEDVLKK